MHCATVGSIVSHHFASRSRTCRHRGLRNLLVIIVLIREEFREAAPTILQLILQLLHLLQPILEITAKLAAFVAVLLRVCAHRRFLLLIIVDVLLAATFQDSLVL